MAIPPLTEEEIRAADDAARRPDGSIDACAFAYEIATDLGSGISSTDKQFRFHFGGHALLAHDDE